MSSIAEDNKFKLYKSGLSNEEDQIIKRSTNDILVSNNHSNESSLMEF